MGNPIEAIADEHAWKGLAALCLSPELRSQIAAEQDPTKKLAIANEYTGLSITEDSFKLAANELVNLLHSGTVSFFPW